MLFHVCGLSHQIIQQAYFITLFTVSLCTVPQKYKLLNRSFTYFKSLSVVSIKTDSYRSPNCMCMLSCIQFFATPHTIQPARLLCPRDSPDKNTEVGCHFPTGNLPNSGIKPTSPVSPALQADSLPLSHLESS